MDPDGLQFPKTPRSDLGNRIDALVDSAERVLTAQGRLRSLLKANRAVVEELDLAHVLRRITEAAVSLVSAEYGALGLFDAEGRLMHFVHVGLDAGKADTISHPPAGLGLLGAIIASGEAIRLSDLNKDPRSVGFPVNHPPMVSFLGIPIRVRDAVYGNLYLTNSADGEFTLEDEELVTALAATAAIAIENARLYEASQDRERVSSALAEVTSALLSPETSDVLGVVADIVASVIQARLVTIIMRHSDAELRVETARGEGAEGLAGAVFAVEGSLVARALNSGKACVSEVGTAATDFGGRGTRGPTIAVPLGGDPQGVLCIIRGPNAAPFSTSDLAVASEFAVQAGLAVTVARARLDRQRLDLADDRNRTARDLHDNVIQRLFGTGLGLRTLTEAAPAHEETIAGFVAELDAAISEIRTAVFTLTARSAAQTSTMRHRLIDVVNDLAPTLPDRPRITFTGPVDLLIVDELADDVTAVVRESLANVARHARATYVTVGVTVTEVDATVVIEDNGIGIPTPLTRSSGTANLTARAEEHGGTFELTGLPNGGARACWNVPILTGRRFPP